ncbi:TetR/AcrR family transcriptional regulator [bacterium]|nr:TetR/AcrR family transcriptional regulator [bacterium]
MNKRDGKSRKELEREARKQDILEMAAQLFALRGFHEVKVDDIADGVGLSKGTIYLYFENKENLFFSILMERFKALNTRLQAAVDENDNFHERLNKFIYTYLHFFKENEAFYKIVHSEKTRMSMESHYKLHEYGKISYFKLFEMVIQLIKEGVEAGELRSMEPRSIALSLVGILNMYIYRSIFQSSDRDVEVEVNEIIDLFLNGAKR